MNYVPVLIYIFGFSTLSFVLTMLVTPAFIGFLHKNRFGKQIREESVDGAKSTIFRSLHGKKVGTPTGAGILVWGMTAVIVLLSGLLTSLDILPKGFSVLDRGQTYLPLFTLVVTGLLGALDDYYNIRGIGTKKGIGAKPKMFWLTLFALMGAWWFYSKLGYNELHLPALGDFFIGLWYIPLFAFVIIASSNAVNITDGLDGLAAGLLIMAFGAFGVLAFVDGLFILTAFCGILIGSLTAFLWYNIPPARFIMGDTGSLSFGATLGVIAMLTNGAVILPIIGFVFVMETMSSMLQICWKRFFGRKLFSIAPFHHLLEHRGFPEHNVTMRLWIVGGVAAVIGVIIGLLGFAVGSHPQAVLGMYFFILIFA
ncbi:phospho-N-acetylmuramoyl-pentapeptide-transferase [Candidatus Gracilibacteria bacterium]|nr:phospho-N-acetylmuramoyl-pentapeptide-transferase [Candidatus Gracilibacteria bacterium]